MKGWRGDERLAHRVEDVRRAAYTTIYARIKGGR